MARSGLLLCALFGAAAHAAEVNPDGPFGDGTSNEPVVIDNEKYNAFVKGNAREGHTVVLLFTQGDSGRTCDLCPYYEKQFDDFVSSYKQQLRGGAVYTEDHPVYFVKAYDNRHSDAIKRDVRSSVPSMTVLPAWKEGAANTPVQFGRKKIEDMVAKQLKKESQQVLEELKKAGKKHPSLGQVARRKDRRRKQLMTQEEMEYEHYGVRNMHQFTTNNICKFLRVNAGMQMNVCPQDVPHDFQQKKKPQDLLKNVLVLVVLISGGVWLCRIFAFYFEPVNPNRKDLVHQVHLRHCIESGDSHCMYLIRPDWEIYGTYFLFSGWVFAYSLLAGGMYWNILNGAPWSGRSSVAPGSRQQFGGESAMLGILYSTGTAGMVLAGAALSQKFLDFTRAHNTPYSLSKESREYARFVFAVGGMGVWCLMLFSVLRMFLLKNQSYLWNTSLGLLMAILRPASM